MYEVDLPEGGINNLGALLRAIVVTLRSFWTRAEAYQKFAYVVGILLIGSAVFHTGVLIVMGGSLEGPVSWRKPILFGVSFGLTALSVSWVMTFLPKRRIIGWPLMGALGIANFGEVVWVSMQQWRGVPSHFNTSTPFDGAAFIGGGILILFTITVIAVVTLWTFFSLQTPRSLAWAIRSGMVLLVVSQIIGVTIILNGFSKMEYDPQTGEVILESISSAAIFGAAGSMKMPHALTIHAIQVLPLLALLLRFANWNESRRTQTVVAAMAGYSGLAAISIWQTFNGLATFDLNLTATLVFIISAVGLLIAYAAALVGLQRTMVRGPA